MGHLTAECFGMLNAGICVLQWFLKSTTNFYEHENWELPLQFGCLCWSFAIAGFYGLVCVPPPSLGRSGFPWNLFCSLLVLQGPLSFAADYLNMDQDSVFHVIDRGLAIPLLLMEIWKLLVVWKHSHARRVPAVATVMLMGAVYSFLRSQRAQSEYNVKDFILWHNRWHMYPIFVLALLFYEIYVLTPASSRRSVPKYQRASSKLLSSILMRKTEEEVTYAQVM